MGTLLSAPTSRRIWNTQLVCMRWLTNSTWFSKLEWNILFIVKVKRFWVIEWSYRFPQLCWWLLCLEWSINLCTQSNFFQHMIPFWCLFLEPYPTIQHSNIGVCLGWDIELGIFTLILMWSTLDRSIKLRTLKRSSGQKFAWTTGSPCLGWLVTSVHVEKWERKSGFCS